MRARFLLPFLAATALTAPAFADDVSAWRLFIADHAQPGVTALDLATGETLWSVAQRYGITVEDIQRWNNIKDHRNIPAGKQLVVAAP